MVYILFGKENKPFENMSLGPVEALAEYTVESWGFTDGGAKNTKSIPYI